MHKELADIISTMKRSGFNLDIFQARLFKSIYKQLDKQWHPKPVLLESKQATPVSVFRPSLFALSKCWKAFLILTRRVLKLFPDHN